MASDEDLNRRLRSALAGLEGVSEKRMMGGTCYLLNGNMLSGADRAKSGERRFMFRVGKDNEAEALQRAGARRVEFGGRRMGGMVFVDEAVCDEKTIEAWIGLCLTFVSNLPAK